MDIVAAATEALARVRSVKVVFSSKTAEEKYYALLERSEALPMQYGYERRISHRLGVFATMALDTGDKDAARVLRYIRANFCAEVFGPQTELTPKMLDIKLKQPAVCPACAGRESSTTFRIHDEYVMVECSCPICGKDWEERYAMIRIHGITVVPESRETA